MIYTAETTAAGAVYPYGEQRFSWRLLRYWQEKRGERPMPEENEIDPDELGEDWDYCFLLQARDMANIQDYNFTYLGPKIIDAYYDKTLDEHNEFMVGPNAYRLSSHFQNVLNTHAPMIDDGERVSLHGRRIIYRQILLPLGDASGAVTAIFGGMSYKLMD